jgi:hypothetical protein
VLKNGKRKLVKTGLRSRDGGKLTLILPLNLKTRDLRFEYRGNLLSTKVTSRSTLHIKVRNRKGKLGPLAHPHSSPRGRRPSREASGGVVFQGRRRVELEPHARHAVAAVAAPAVGHPLEDPPAHAALGAGPRAGPGSRTSMCSAPRRSTCARSSMRSCAPRSPCSMLLVDELGDDELDLAGASRLRGSASTARRARTMDAACGGSRWVASWSGTCGLQRRRATDLAVS